MLEPCMVNKIADTYIDYGSENDSHLRFFPPDEFDLIRNTQNLGVEY
jgi:hypothetical protein